MIRMIQSNSSSQAKAYFSDALLKADYYLNDQELQGKLLGHLANRLNIEGIATKETFFALCDNINPSTGGSLTPVTRENRRTGYDINFHCPKSVSIIHALSKDNHIMEAFEESTRKVMKEIEADAKTRVRKNGASEDRKTGELVWAEFIHQTARPVDGSVPDPHLHAHCFVFNATWDEQEKQFKAGQFGDIKRDAPYFQARFHKILSDKLIDLGYQIKRTNTSFEIDGVPRGAIDLFSKRTNEIGQIAKEQGITDAKELGELGARTRSRKQKGLSMDELKIEWRKQISELADYQDGEKEAPIRYAPQKQPSKVIAEDCVHHALKHTFERASVMAERRILETAYKHSIGSRLITLDAITDQFKDDKQIIHIDEKGRTLCTTIEVLKEEQKMVSLARQGQGKFIPLYEVAPDIELQGQQGAAISHTLTSKDQVTIIRGVAGAGKTTLMKELKEHINKAGKEIIFIAPSAEASRGVLVKEGFEDADTVSRLILDENLQKNLQGQYLVVDEAGLLGTKDMTTLLEITSQANARLIVVGDQKQHASVVRGDALRILTSVAGIQAAEVSKIYRQKNVDYRSAVEDLSQGNIKVAFEKLDHIGAIKDIDRLKPNDVLVEDYVSTIKKGKSALIISPTHQQGKSVTADVRVKLRASGLIGKNELNAVKLSNTNMTEAEKADWRSFEKGQIIQFNQNAPQIKRGSVWSIKDVSEKMIIINDSNGKENQLPLDKSNRYNVFKEDEIGLSKGDKVRITHNSFDKQNKRIDNGTSLDVVSINKASGKIVLTNAISKVTYILDKDFGHIDHAYCTTSHSSQGKTVDEVFISQPSSTFTATNAKQIYVSVSRGRDAARIYTDDREALIDYASQIGDRQSALELVKESNKHIDHVLHQERTDFKPIKSDIDKKDYSLNKQNKYLEDYEPEF